MRKFHRLRRRGLIVDWGSDAAYVRLVLVKLHQLLEQSLCTFLTLFIFRLLLHLHSILAPPRWIYTRPWIKDRLTLGGPRQDWKLWNRSAYFKISITITSFTLSSCWVNTICENSWKTKQRRNCKICKWRVTYVIRVTHHGWRKTYCFRVRYATPSQILSWRPNLSL